MLHLAVSARPAARVVGCICLLGMLLAGCATAPPDPQLYDRASLCLHRGMRFPENPAVRAQSIEAAAEVLGSDAEPNIREALADEHPGVRFAACMALGKVGDRACVDAIRRLIADTDPSVRVATYYALERLGDASHRREWADALRGDASPEVRRNAALALGLLGDPRCGRLLGRAAGEDPDDGVRLQANEALVLLGDQDAQAKCVRDAFGGIGFRQPFALLALGHIRSNESANVLRSRLGYAPYLEAKLAAARGLAMQGSLDGFDLALQSLSWNSPRNNQVEDPPENQIMRVRTMAAMALGDMRDRRALPALSQCLETSVDPRIQVAAARAILMILGNSQAGRPISARTQPAL